MRKAEAVEASGAELTSEGVERQFAFQCYQAILNGRAAAMKD